MNAITATLLRSLLKVGAGVLVAKGFLDDSNAEIIIAGLVALVGVIWGIVHRTPPTPPTGTAPVTVPIKSLTGQPASPSGRSSRPGALMSFAMLGFVSASLLFGGCAALSPGADPIAVRAEQSIQVAFSTFDTFLKTDDLNRDFFRTYLPEVHDFAEYLREKVGDPPTARGIAFVESANRVRLTYKRSRTAENKASLVTALAVLESAVAETQKQLADAQPSTLNPPP